MSPRKPGPGRPPGSGRGRWPVVSVRVPPELHEAVHRAADEACLTTPEWLRRVLERETGGER